MRKLFSGKSAQALKWAAQEGGLSHHPWSVQETFKCVLRDVV